MPQPPAELPVKSFTIPPPVQGWNAKDSVAAMSQDYAVEMINYFPTGATVDMRKGYTKFAQMTNHQSSGLGAIMEYVRSDGTKYMLVSTGNTLIYDATAGGTVSALSASTSITETPFYVNFRDRIFIKGFDNTSDVYSWQASGGLSLAGFTGPGGDDKALWKMYIYKSRIYFQGFDASIWYGGTDNITGALTQFDFSSIFIRGGGIAHIGSISLNNTLSSELFVAISEMGEVLVYSGTSPDSSSWQEVGRYFLAAPVGRCSFFQWKNDIVIMTREGVVSLLDVVNSGNGDYSYLSDLINPVYKDLIADIGAIGVNIVSGFHYPAGNFIGIHVVTLTDGPILLVMNTITRAWCKFTNLGDGWGLYNNNLYFRKNGSANGYVMKFDDGYYDENPDNTGVSHALSRACKLRPAYNFFQNRERPYSYFGDPQPIRQFVMAIPYVYEQYGLSLTMDADIDFRNKVAVSKTEDLSDVSYKFYSPRVGLTGQGKCASVRIDETVTQKRRSIQAIEVFWKDGALA